jgi:hypothetical protein
VSGKQGEEVVVVVGRGSATPLSPTLPSTTMGMEETLKATKVEEEEEEARLLAQEEEEEEVVVA